MISGLIRMILNEIGRNSSFTRPGGFIIASKDHLLWLLAKTTCCVWLHGTLSAAATHASACSESEISMIFVSFFAFFVIFGRESVGC